MTKDTKLKEAPKQNAKFGDMDTVNHSVAAMDILADSNTQMLKVMQFAQMFQNRLKKSRALIHENNRHIVYSEHGLNHLKEKLYELVEGNKNYKDSMAKEVRSFKRNQAKYEILGDELAIYQDQAEGEANAAKE